MSFSGITTQQNSQNNNINTPDILPLYGEVVNKWCLSGKTCTPSKASIGSTVTLKIDVTSFSESSGAGSTPLCFIVNGNNVHTVDVSSTGVYTYNWNVGLNYGNISFHAKYLSGSEFEEYYPAHTYSKSMVFFRNAYSTFGDSTIHVKKYLNVTGYDGNSSIYLSNICYQPTYGIYGNVNISSSHNVYTGTGVACKSVIIGNTAYTSSDSCGNFYIHLNMTETGAGKRAYIRESKSNGACHEPYELKTLLQTSCTDSSTCVQFDPHFVGYNVTNMDGTCGEQEMRDVTNLMADGLSLVPGYGYIVTAAEAAGTAQNLIQCLNSAYKITATGSGNQPADVVYKITGGSGNTLCEGSNVYASGVHGHVKIPNSDLKHNFKIKITYETVYQCGINNYSTTASTTQTINAVPASAIYGSVGQSNTSQVRDANLTSSLYIENANTHTFYNATIKNGTFLFFAQPEQYG